MTQIEITSTVTKPPGPFTPLGAPFDWMRFANYPNYWAAHIVAELLENEGVPAIIESNSVFPGAIGYATVWIPQQLAHRARWILALQPPTEAELIFMATGELPA